MTHQVTIMPAVTLRLGRDSQPMPQPHALSIATPPTNGTAVISRKPNKGTTILPAPVRCGRWSIFRTRYGVVVGTAPDGGGQDCSPLVGFPTDDRGAVCRWRCYG